MTNLQTAIIYASAIGSILNEWSAKESTRAILDLRGQIKKFMYKRSRSNQKEFLEAIKIGDKAWTATIDQFKDSDIKIEAASTIIALWSAQADSMARFANLTQKRVDRFAMMLDGSNSLEVEQNAYTVADALIENINKEIGCK